MQWFMVGTRVWSGLRFRKHWSYLEKWSLLGDRIWNMVSGLKVACLIWPITHCELKPKTQTAAKITSKELSREWTMLCFIILVVCDTNLTHGAWNMWVFTRHGVSDKIVHCIMGNGSVQCSDHTRRKPTSINTDTHTMTGIQACA